MSNGTFLAAIGRHLSVGGGGGDVHAYRQLAGREGAGRGGGGGWATGRAITGAGGGAAARPALPHGTPPVRQHVRGPGRVRLGSRPATQQHQIRRAREEPMPGLAPEIAHAQHRAVVLAPRLVELNAHPLSSAEVRAADKAHHAGVPKGRTNTVADAQAGGGRSGG
eukprot:scaffold3124_cov64-Isochrysis_galbana.AAC.1